MVIYLFVEPNQSDGLQGCPAENAVPLVASNVQPNVGISSGALLHIPTQAPSMEQGTCRRSYPPMTSQQHIVGLTFSVSETFSCIIQAHEQRKALFKSTHYYRTHTKSRLSLCNVAFCGTKEHQNFEFCSKLL
jgi:hypothetical protein